ncbi:MAG: FtsX-like permease family protein [Eubacterium ventriosum]
MMKVSDNTAEIIRLMTNVIVGCKRVCIICFRIFNYLCFEIFNKRRNREFGIYLTLGMGKRKISFILFIETLAIGMISLATGLIVGAGLSQLMSIFVANMFEADITKV